MNKENINNRIAIFRNKAIRKAEHNGEWWFSVEDAVLVFIDLVDPKQYIQKMKKRDTELEKRRVQIIRTSEVETRGGSQKMNCANAEGIFRIMQNSCFSNEATI